MKNHNKHRLKIKDWFEMETSEKVASRVVALGWCFGIGYLLTALPDFIRVLVEVLK